MSIWRWLVMLCQIGLLLVAGYLGLLKSEYSEATFYLILGIAPEAFR